MPDERPPARWAVALRRTPVSLWRDDIDHWAAALTYYSVLAVFPTLMVAMSVTGLADPAAAQELLGHVTALLPAGAGSDVRTTLRDLSDQRSTAWLVVAVGSASAWLSAYNYLSVFRRVLHGMHGVEDRRPPWRTVPLTMLTSLGLLALLVGSATVLILTGGAVRTIGRLLGLGEAGTTAWNVLKWPLLVVLVTGLVLVLFRTGPAGTRAPWRSAPGGALAVLLWLVASAGFALYASHVPTYHRLYGSLAGIIVFLVWLWVSNLTLLAGAQFNAELARPDPAPALDPGPAQPAAVTPAAPATPAASAARRDG
ncbi:YihY/virulence factor BrkB family protein [Streptomyces litchfieldiae]|uniref:YihY/virulence factor BrkB family protein n=1 Tax=Streptomyces litchfieldiae TaxID=3075543 RepID=A0ABU2MTW1_9ACTN|nr:YihY/virulence factor BrkB family protein [Streptomyces sp. DSM 44938]MDT0344519.1 YihY/virulence factor BrkB family protein [Streptomyces sp. DSM 44938]